MLIKILFPIILCMLALPVVADAPFIVSTNGLEVTDTKTGLIWRRCPLGMNLSQDNCTGTPSASLINGALEMAKNQANGLGVAWRLPNIQELSSITDLNRQTPSIDAVAFPSTPSRYFWSSTPSESGIARAWAVDFDSGSVTLYGDFVGQKSAYVRLVRTP